MSIKKRQKRSALLAYIILAVGAVFMIIPFLWMVLTSFKTYRETVKLPIQWFPAEWNFDNYVEVLKQLDFLRYYRNTILVTVTTLVAMTLIASLAAYAFARMEFPGKNVIFALLLVVYMVPPQMTMIPKYDDHKTGLGRYTGRYRSSKYIQCVYNVYAAAVFCFGSERTG